MQFLYKLVLWDRTT